ncbi:MAG: aspartate/glutamate racemase family protein [Pseudomonadota bacterium]
MSVIIINPNSTTLMTEAMLEAARCACPSLTFEGWTSHRGPPAIQGPEDGARAEAPLLDLVQEADARGAQGIVIGCFDDTALAQASKLASCPVIGIGQASYHHAALRGWRFSVVTTLAVSVPILEQNINDLGLDRFLGRVRASDVAVLELNEDQSAADARVVAEAERAAREDDVDAVILGCAGMVEVADKVRRSVGLSVLDPTIVAARCMGWLL